MGVICTNLANKLGHHLVGKLGRSSPIYHKFPAKGATCTLLVLGHFPAGHRWEFPHGPSTESVNILPTYWSLSFHLDWESHSESLRAGIQICRNRHLDVPEILRKFLLESWVNMIFSYIFHSRGSRREVKRFAGHFWNSVAMLRVWTLSWLQGASGVDLRNVVNLA